jgi:exopolysaccharide biosynthesis polyprenyl glycosylphosphotransferase
MNGAAARRALSAPVMEGTSQEAAYSEYTTAPQLLTRGRNRGKSLVRGLSVQVTYAVVDAMLVFAIGLIALWLRFGITLLVGPDRRLFDESAGHTYAGFFILYAALVVMGCTNQDLYRTPRDRRVLDESLKVAKAVGAATTLLVPFIFTSGYKDISRLVVLSAGLLNVGALSGWRYFKRQVVLRRVAAGIGISRVLIIGSGRLGKALADFLQKNPHLGYSVCGFLDDKPSSDRILGSVGDLRHLALTQFVDELFITLPSDREVVKALVLQARQLRLGLKILPDLYDGLGWRAPLHMIGGFPIMDLHRQPIPFVGLALKRALDVFVSGFLLVATIPFLPLLVILVRMDSRGSFFYSADRVGLKGRKFKCYKLRTMVADADLQKEKLRKANEREGPFFKIENDPRITHLGRWLRRYSLDEVPQLWNVLRGDMSLVGPRPHPVDDYERYSVEHLRRLDVSPGLTGLWQVMARSDPSFETNMALDLEYIENWSLGLDLKILLKTIPALLRVEGR